ncbi:MAG TPA: trypsin-like peptidase domain-containing protein [Gaiellaceae bacterium]|nr:trypsin-like peptidase domain-containing protein [Gaiellaceae bacterium]
MRPASLALVALIAAVLGGGAALAIGRAGGWLAGTTTATYMITEQEPASPAAVQRVAGPLVSGAFDPARIYATRSPGVVTVYAYAGAVSGAPATQSQGSGFVVSRGGVVLTSSHVITNAGEAPGSAPVRPAKAVYVEFADGDRLPARIVGWDVFDDVGVLRVDPSRHALAPLPLGDSSRVVIGEPVAAIGSPFGNTDSLSVGVVSATRAIASLTSQYELADAIQTDAPINHGNSGGPLFDARGRVIGINAQLRSGPDASGSAGVGFAVPIDAAKRSLHQLLTKGRVAYAYLGVGTEDLTPSLARHLGYSVLHGALVDRVEAGTAAAAAGFRAGRVTAQFAGEQVRVGGDVIVAIDGEPVRRAADVVRIVGEELEPGQLARFTVVRGTARRVIPVRLRERPAR